MSQYYILAGHEAVPVEDSLTWASWYETADRTVVKTQVLAQASWLAAITLGWLGRRQRAALVSTVFLGLDHNFGDGPPLLFETLVLDGTLAGEMERYATWEEAEQGHAWMVERVIKEDT